MVVILMLVMVPCSVFATNPVPRNLALYYGWPSACNGLGSNEAVAQMFAKYDLVVFGDGLEFSTHGDHANTEAIIARMKQLNSDIEIFGYIPLGNRAGIDTCLQMYATTANPTPGIHERVAAWDEMGANGIFYDTYGCDYGVNRERQNVSAIYAMFRNMRVIANCFNIEYVFSKGLCNVYNADGTVKFVGNPNLSQSNLWRADYYLFENQYTQIGSSGNYLNGLNRNQEVVDYFTKPQAAFNGQTYSQHYETRLIALDGINSTWSNKTALYNSGKTKAQNAGMSVYGASGLYWGANNTFYDYLP